METKNAKIVYPLFEPNQILSSTHLNNLRNFLDSENRVTRTHLSGVGIVCGLSAQLKKDISAVLVTPGYGITTDGYLLEHSDDDDTTTKPGEPIEYPYYRVYKDPSDPPYQYGKPVSSGDIVIGEVATETLLATKKAATTVIKPITDTFDTTDLVFELRTTKPKNGKEEKVSSEIGTGKRKITDFCVVLYCEAYDAELRSCTGSNCDNKGKQREYTLRVLLVHKSLLSIYNPEAVLTRDYNLPQLEIRRIASEFSVVNPLVYFNSPEAIQEEYTTLSAKQAMALIDQLDNVRPRLWRMGLTNQMLDDAISQMQVIVKLALNYAQYKYDLFCDLTMTWNEFVEAAEDWMEACGMLPDNFPRHLTLCLLKEDDRARYYDEYRTSFWNAAPIDKQDRRLLKMQMLWQKMLHQAMGFDMPGKLKDGIRITPGKFAPAPLTDWAIPYYYNPKEVSSRLLRLWNPQASLRSNEKNRNGYFADTWTDNEINTKPLLYSIKDKPFYRIEGIAGMNYQTALNTLEDLRQQYNLAFDIVALKLEDDGVVRVSGGCGYQDLDEEYIIARNVMLDAVRKVADYFDTFFAVVKKQITKEAGTTVDEIRDYILALREITLEMLPPCLKDFDYNAFKEAYKTFLDTTVTWLMRQLNGATAEVLEKWLSEEAYTIGQVIRSLASDLVYGLSNALAHNRLYHVYYRLKLREYRKSKQLVLSAFAQKHPGMEHLAGVMNGGTFILVYQSDRTGKDVILDGVEVMTQAIDAFGRVRASVEDMLKMQRELELLRSKTAATEPVAETPTDPETITPPKDVVLDFPVKPTVVGFVPKTVIEVPKDVVNPVTDKTPGIADTTGTTLLGELAKNISTLKGTDKTDMTRLVKTLGTVLGINPKKTETESKVDDLALRLEELASLNETKIGSDKYASDISKIQKGLSDISASIAKGESADTFAADVEKAQGLVSLLGSSVESDAAKKTGAGKLTEIEDSTLIEASPKSAAIAKAVTAAAKSTTTAKTTTTTSKTTSPKTISVIKKTSGGTKLTHSDNTNKPVKVKKGKTTKNKVKKYNALGSSLPKKVTTTKLTTPASKTTTTVAPKVRLAAALTDNERKVLATVSETKTVTDDSKEVLTKLAASEKVTTANAKTIAKIVETGEVKSSTDITKIIEKADTITQTADTVKSVVTSDKLTDNVKATFSKLLDDSKGTGVNDLADIRKAAEDYLKANKITAEEKKALDALADHKEEILSSDDSRKKALGIIDSENTTAAEKAVLTDLLSDEKAGMTLFRKVDDVLKKTDASGKRILGEAETAAIVDLLDRKKGLDPEGTVAAVIETKVTDPGTKDLLNKLLNPKLGNGFREPSLIEKVIETSGLGEILTKGEKAAFDSLLADKRDAHADDASRNAAKDLIYSNTLTTPQFNTVIELMSDDKFTPSLENKFRVFFENPVGDAAKVEIPKKTLESLRDLLNRKKFPPAEETTEKVATEETVAEETVKAPAAEIPAEGPIYLPPTTDPKKTGPATASEIIDTALSGKEVSDEGAAALMIDFVNNLMEVSASLSERISANRSEFRSRALSGELFAEIEPKNVNQLVIADFALPYQCCGDLLCSSDCVDDVELAKLPIPPFAKDDFAVTVLEKTIDIPVLLNDHPLTGNQIDIYDDLVEEPKHGKAVVVRPFEGTPFIRYSPDTETPTEDHFRYRIKNTINGLIDEANVWIRITDFPPVIFTIDTTNICKYDGIMHPLNIDLKGRDPKLITVAGPGFFISRKDGLPYFDPSAPGVVRGDNVLYMFYGSTQIAELHINVIMPEASFKVFSVTPNAFGGADLQMQNLSVDANAYEWTAYGLAKVAVKTSNDKDPLFSFTADEIGIGENVTITLRVRNTGFEGGCISPEVSIVVPVQIQLPASLKPDRSFVCQKDSPVLVVIDAPARNPLDLTITGNGISQNNVDLKWYFNPSAPGVILGANHLELFDGGQFLSSCDITVMQPKAQFVIGAVEKPGPTNGNKYVVNFNNTSIDANTYFWTVLGKTSSVKNPRFEFTEAELVAAKFKALVTLTASHTLLTCSDTKELLVTIEQAAGPVDFALSAKEVCFTDVNPYFTISSPGRNFNDLQVVGNGAFLNPSLMRWEVDLRNPSIIYGENIYDLKIRATGERLGTVTLNVIYLDAHFNYSADVVDGKNAVIHLSSTNQLATDFAWMLPGFDKFTGRIVDIILPWPYVQEHAGIASVTLQVTDKNTLCSNSMTVDINLYQFVIFSGKQPVQDYVPSFGAVMEINNFIYGTPEQPYTYSGIFFESGAYQQTYTLDNAHNQLRYQGFFQSPENVVSGRQQQVYSDIEMNYASQLSALATSPLSMQYLNMPETNDLQLFFRNEFIILLSLVSMEAADIQKESPYMTMLDNCFRIMIDSEGLRSSVFKNEQVQILLFTLQNATYEKPELNALIGSYLNKIGLYPKA